MTINLNAAIALVKSFPSKALFIPTQRVANILSNHADAGTYSYSQTQRKSSFRHLAFIADSVFSTAKIFFSTILDTNPSAVSKI